VEQKAQRVDENVTLFTSDQLAPIEPMGIDARPPCMRIQLSSQKTPMRQSFSHPPDLCIP
jgi:hypothetical protein